MGAEQIKEQAIKALKQLIKKLENDDVEVTKVSFENGVIKIPVDDLGIYKYEPSGYQSVTIEYHKK